MVKITASKVISVQGKRDAFGQISGMSLNINFDSIKFEGGKLFVVYTYTVNYEEKVGVINVTGELTIEDANIKKFEDEYKKTKTLPTEIAEEIITASTFTASATGTLLAYGLNLPAPLNVPKAKLNPNATKQAS